MRWCYVIRVIEGGRFHVVEQGELIQHDDPKYGEVHIVPFTKKGDEMNFGVHEFTPQCCCRPKFDHRGQRELVIHEERPVN